MTCGVAAAVLALAVGDLKDAIVISVVLVVNAALGFLQEARAERSLAALRSMLVPTARVRRDGATVEVDAADLVPGDLVLLDAGERVPADGHLRAAHALEIDESTLTGESTAHCTCCYSCILVGELGGARAVRNHW